MTYILKCVPSGSTPWTIEKVIKILWFEIRRPTGEFYFWKVDAEKRVDDLNSGRGINRKGLIVKNRRI